MISKRIQSLKGSPTLALAAKAGELRAAGEDVISLSVGEPDWDTFDSIKNAAKVAMDEGKTKYTPVGGTPQLRQAIAKQTSADLNVDYKAENVTVSSGGKFVIYSALQTFLDPGDEVLIPSPYWVSYPDMVGLVGGVPKIVTTQAENRFKVTPNEIRKAITEKTKILILNSPSNPTGEMYSESELFDLAEVIKVNPNLIVLSDDIYNRLVFDQPYPAPHLLQQCPELQSRTIVINGVSKTYSMTGWRLGWAVGPKEVVAAMTRFQSQTTSCASSITQAAALEAVENGQAAVTESLKVLKERRDYIYSELSAIDSIQVDEPKGAFYIWPDVSASFGKSFQGETINNSDDFARCLLESQKVVTVPGSAFGQDGRLRVSYALERERMAEAVSRLKAFLAELV